jgi:hypothetical protein
MKKITIGIVTFLFFQLSTTFAASQTTGKNQVAVPCYNGGFSFGLAGYTPVTPNKAPASINETKISREAKAV